MSALGLWMCVCVSKGGQLGGVCVRAESDGTNYACMCTAWEYTSLSGGGVPPFKSVSISFKSENSNLPVCSHGNARACLCQ